MDRSTHGRNAGQGGFNHGGTDQGGFAPGGFGQSGSGAGPNQAASGPPSFTPNTHYPDDFGQGGFGQTDYTKIILFGCVMLAVMALGGLLVKWSSAPAPAIASPPVVPLHVQAQQAAIEALNTHQQMMIDMRRQMAEAQQGYYEDSEMVEFRGDEDGGW